MRRFFSQIRFAVFQNLWLENAVQISPLYFDFQHFKIRLLGSRCAARFKRRTQAALYRFRLMIPQFLYSSTFIRAEAVLICRVKYGVSITGVTWEHTGWNTAHRSAGRGGGICSGEWNCTGMENVGRWKTYLKDAPNLPPAQVFHADNLTKTVVCREKEREQNLQPAVCSQFLFAVYAVCQFFAENWGRRKKLYPSRMIINNLTAEQRDMSFS